MSRIIAQKKFGGNGVFRNKMSHKEARQGPVMISNRALLLAVSLLPVWPIAWAAESSKGWAGHVPKTWDEAELAEWATPVAGLNVRPGHISSAEYYSLPVENYRLCTVYMPGREPEGYWKKLQVNGPKPLSDGR